MDMRRTVVAGLVAVIASLLTGCGGTTPSSPPPSGGTQRSAGLGYSAAFAACMRAHGIPRFPDPGGTSPFAPGSGIDPGSSAFQAAVNGPCRALAPSGWVSSGPVTGT